MHKRPRVEIVTHKPDPGPEIAKHDSDTTDRSCEVGLMECGDNADCVPRENSKSMVGTCQCKEGFVFDTGGNCIQAILEKTVIT